MSPFASNVRISNTTPTDVSEYDAYKASATKIPGEELSTSLVTTTPSAVSAAFVPREKEIVEASFRVVPISYKTEVCAVEANADEDVRMVDDSVNGIDDDAMDVKLNKNRYLFASVFIK